MQRAVLIPSDEYEPWTLTLVPLYMDMVEIKDPETKTYQEFMKGKEYEYGCSFIECDSRDFGSYDRSGS